MKVVMGTYNVTKISTFTLISYTLHFVVHTKFIIILF
jgi:hypothetical protein